MRPSLKITLLVLLALWQVGPARAHGGEDHGGTAKASGGAFPTTFSVAALSEKFELLLRFEPLEKGQDADLRLFLSDYATNAPIKGAKLTITCPEAPTLRFAVSEQEPGSYLVESRFPENKKYSLAVNIVAGSQADLMALQGLEVGKKLPVAPEAPAAAGSVFSSWKTILALVGAFALGILLTVLLLRRRAAAPVSTSTPPVYENHA
ncbi:hypothetical protein E5K00_08625 [Hymenobacter aquaticus]|uniref:Uncharacterized protein n=1 Tax=Hymenobacter aquaticus TaxID=1867101 RepID=A0A4Z0Q743_9BACT|nr:hypothetical protein [Hymenobacter aquaticus]TGE25239.1 hypothetical protein E5K00_08625 [Hymenobacter aquaticus]